MVTPNEIRAYRFEVVKRGYEPTAVDDALEAAASTIAELIGQKDELEQKLLLLADKIEEYREDEDKIRATLLAAQKMSDTIIREATQKGEILMRDASIKAERLVGAAQSKVTKQEQALEQIKLEVSSFKQSMLEIYKNHLSALNMIPDYDEEPTDEEPITPPVEEPPIEQPAEPDIHEADDGIREFIDDFEVSIATDFDDVQDAADEDIVESLERTEEFTSEDFSLEPQIDQEADAPTHRFGKLDFGDDYSFKK